VREREKKNNHHNTKQHAATANHNRDRHLDQRAMAKVLEAGWGFSEEEEKGAEKTLGQKRLGRGESPDLTFSFGSLLLCSCKAKGGCVTGMPPNAPRSLL
jgi:hypothetical protein